MPSGEQLLALAAELARQNDQELHSLGGQYVICAHWRASSSSCRASAPRIDASEQLDRVKGGQRPPGAAQRSADLDQAARVGADVGLRTGLQHHLGLAIAELQRRLGLDDVVDAGAPAADVGLGRLEHAQSGHLGEHGPRLTDQALRVLQVAGVLEGDAQLERVALREGASGQELVRCRPTPAIAWSLRCEPQPAALVTMWS